MSARTGNWQLWTRIGLVIAAAVALSGSWTHGPDRAMAQALRDAEGNPFGGLLLVEFSRDLTALGSTLVLGLLCCLAVGAYVLLRRLRDAVWAAFLLFGAWPVALGLKMLWNRPRPTAFEASAYTFSPSFPSAHAMLSMVVLVGIALLVTPREGPNSVLRVPSMILAVALAFGVGLSRLHLGVHHPSDVLAGWLFGTAWLAIVIQMREMSAHSHAHRADGRRARLGPSRQAP